MQVRVYIDGFNLYYGGKRLTASSPGTSWKWIDLRQLAATVIRQRWAGRSPIVDHVTYCTARIVGGGRPFARQAAYLRALELSGSVDQIEYGLFKERYREFPLAVQGTSGRPVLRGGRVQLVGVSFREEKGSDVNLASRLLIDALNGRMDAAVVLSNDSDLELPIREVRTHMPVGTISPHGPVHGSLRPRMTPGCGHWYHTLGLAELSANQLPDPCHGISCPSEWTQGEAPVKRG